MEAKQCHDFSWESKVDHVLCRESMVALMMNQIPFLRIPHFASPGECERIVALAAAEGFSPYRDVEPKINRIGNTVFEYNHISKDEYFTKNEEIRQVQERIFKGAFDPVERFIEVLKAKTGFSVKIARNERNLRYYAGLIRRIEEGTLIHVDFAPQEQPDWEVGQVTHQLAWNLYLRTRLNNDGATYVFNRQWLDGDERHKEGSYGYHPVVVEGSENVSFEPQVGEVVIFNTRNFHFVEPTSGERVTVTSAIGRLPSDELVLWS